MTFRALSVIIILLCSSLSGVIAQAQNTPTIELIGSSWGNGELHALIITNESQSWWKPYFVIMTQRAIDEWNQAIDYFATNYADFEYLSKLNIQTTVSNQSLPGFDINIYFSDKVLINTVDALGRNFNR